MNVAILQQRMDLIMFLYAVLTTIQLSYLKCMLVTFWEVTCGYVEIP